MAAMAAFVLAAAVIGGVFLFNVLDTVTMRPTRAQASVEQNLARDVSYDLPDLASLVGLNDDGHQGRRSPTPAWYHRRQGRPLRRRERQPGPHQAARPT